MKRDWKKEFVDSYEAINNDEKDIDLHDLANRIHRVHLTDTRLGRQIRVVLQRLLKVFKK